MPVNVTRHQFLSMAAIFAITEYSSFIYRLQMEREPCVVMWEARRKSIPDITKTMVFYRKYASAEAEKLVRELNCDSTKLASGDKTICKVFKGCEGEWLLDAVGEVGKSEVFVMLEPDTKHELSKGLSLRFGSASVITIDGDSRDETDASSFQFSSFEQEVAKG
jgi:hypothetical protein